MSLNLENVVTPQRGKDVTMPHNKRMGNRPDRGTTRSGSIYTDIGKSGRVAMPVPSLFTAVSGRVASTDVIADRVMTAKISAMLIPNNGFLWSGTSGKAFQDGNSSVSDVNTINKLLSSMYSMIVRNYMRTSGRFVRDTVLDNAGTIPALASWLNNYCSAYVQLRGLQGVLAAGDINQTISLISNTVNDEIFRLQSDIQVLQTYCVPPALIELLDAVCGVFQPTQDQTPIIAGCVPVNATTSAVLDMTSDTNIIQILTNVETLLKSLESGSSTNSSADCARIANLFGMCYERPSFGPKPVITDPGLYAVQTTQGVSYLDTTSSSGFGWPNTSLVGTMTDTVPVLIPDGSSALSTKMLLSLMRPFVYNTDATNGVADSLLLNFVGWITNRVLANKGLEIGTYDQLQSFTATNVSGAGVNDIAYNSFAYDLIWASEASNEATDYSKDTRNFPGMKRVYVTADFLLEETMYWIESIFLDPIS